MKEVSSMTLDMPPGLEARLSGIEAMLAQIHEAVAAPRVPREWYTVEEVAAMVNKTSYTVREWCREGRINAAKRPEKRGGAELWNISADEVARYKDEGLLAPDPYRNMGRSR
jgi:excisionase family DNA binding protein